MHLKMAGFSKREIKKMTPLQRAGYLTIYSETLEQMYGSPESKGGDDIPPEVRSQITMPR